MKSFFATIETETGDYTIDQKPPVNGVTYFAVNWHSGAVYFNSVAECLEWIKEHSEYVLSTAV
jgi:hypothetical protein